MARPTYGKELSPEERKKVSRVLGGMGELALSGATGAIAEPIAGWGGLLSGGNAEAVDKIKENLTYRPRSDEAYEVLGAAGEAVPDWMKELTRAYGKLGEAAGEVNPALGAAVDTVPAAVGALIPLAGRAKALGAMVPEGRLNRQAGILRGLSPQMAAEHPGVRALQEGGVPEEVWAEHGVARMPGFANKYVDEIDDSGAKLERLDMIDDFDERLSSLLKHPELYKKAPPMRHATQSNEFEGSMAGSWDPDSMHMTIHPEMTDAERLTTAIHEAQHGVAGLTGLPQGSSPSWEYGHAKNMIDALRGERKGAIEALGIDESLANDLYTDPNSIFSDLVDKNTPEWKRFESINENMAKQYDITNKEFRKYNDSMGEALARMAEGRRTMSAAERRQSYPFSVKNFKQQTGTELVDALKSMLK